MASRTKSGIFIIAQIPGAVGERIATLQAAYDPLLVKLGRPRPESGHRSDRRRRPGRRA
jgi:hypothetical protein